MSSMQKSQSKKAIEGRRWRANAKEKKQFNTVVVEYIHHKYDDIYNECCQIYRMLKQKHSDAHNLTKTRTFRRMVEDLNENNDVSATEAELPNQTDRDEVQTPDVSATEAELPNQTDRDKAQTPDVSATEAELPNQTDRDEAQTPVVPATEAELSVEPARDDNILSTAIQDALVARNYVNIDEIHDADNVIDQIIADLETNDAVRNILNDAVDVMAQEMFAEYDHEAIPMDMDEDEGIGLNVEVEITDDIEELDYFLEVEPFDF